MAAVRNVLVIGGGIGGLTAGVALRQAGIETDLVEVKPELSVYGVGIIQPNNTLRALDKIGLAQRCVELGTPFPGWRIHDADGNFLMAAPNGNSAAPNFPPINGITRPDLQRVLHDAAVAHGVAIRLGTHVVAIESGADAVAVELSDGTKRSYDFVIGCDGLYSDTRTRLFGDAVKPHYTGQAVWRYNLHRPKRVEWGEVHYGIGCKVGLTPLKPDLMYMFLVTPEPDNPHMPVEGLAARMRERLQHYGGFIGELREQITDDAGVVYKPLENALMPQPWHKGRTLIIGDAAHATTPHLAQGAAMAIEDAVLLGELLGRDEPVAALLDEFMRRRYLRAKFVVDSSDQIATWELEDWAGIRNSNAELGALLHSATEQLLEDY